MSQNDFIIADAVTPTVRADINSAFAAIVTQSSGASAPSPTYANMMWYDTNNDLLKMRSELDDAWITIGSLDQTANTFIPAGVLDEDNMVSDDPLRPASQQSTKAYVDTEVAAVGYTAPTTAGDVGTYVFARRISGSTDVTFGSTLAGSSLSPTSAFSQQVSNSGAGYNMITGSALSGTWQAMGYYDFDGGAVYRGATLWLRTV